MAKNLLIIISEILNHLGKSINLFHFPPFRIPITSRMIAGNFAMCNGMTFLDTLFFSFAFLCFTLHLVNLFTHLIVAVHRVDGWLCSSQLQPSHTCCDLNVNFGLFAANESRSRVVCNFLCCAATLDEWTRKRENLQLKLDSTQLHHY